MLSESLLFSTMSLVLSRLLKRRRTTLKHSSSLYCKCSSTIFVSQNTFLMVKRQIKMSALFAIFTSLIVLNYSSCGESLQHTTHCVVNNATRVDCPGLKVKFNCTKCKLLSFYVRNVNKYFTNNTEMIFTEGEHCLHPPSGNSTVVNVTHVTNFVMRGLGNVSYDSQREGAIQPSTTITCRCSRNRSGVLFYKSDTIKIENLAIKECGAKFILKRPDYFSVISALTFREACNTYLTRVHMERNVGFGFIADRNYGNMSVSYSAFMGFKVIKSTHMFSGNARFWYSYVRELHNHFSAMLKIEHSLFRDGHNKWSKNTKSAAGLTILIYIPKVKVFIDNIKTINNSDGNLAVLILNSQTDTSSVTINNSVVAQGSGVRGGGLRFWIKMWKVRRRDSVISSHDFNHDLATVMNTLFLRNFALDTGGAVYITYFESNVSDNIHRNVYFHSCQFIGNAIKKTGRSYTGAAVQAFKHHIAEIVPHTSPQFFLNFTNCTFRRNKLNMISNEGGILDFVSTGGIIIHDSNFSSNEGTAISLRNSNVQFVGHNVFKNNTGIYGGALKLCQVSKMYLHLGNKSRMNVIEFINNFATSMGGAIYVAYEQCVETSPPCFFQIALTDVKGLTDLLKNLTLRLVFRNNSAQLAGDAVYGGLVDYCYLINVYNYKVDVYPSNLIFNKIFDFTQQTNTSLSTISSAPYGGCFCKSTNDILDSLTCTNMTYPQIVVPGQTITIGVSSVGQRNGTAPISSVYFSFLGSAEQDNSTQLLINYGQGKRQLHRCNVLNCTIYSNQTTANFALSIELASRAEQRYVRHKPPSLTIHLGKCPWGFALTTSPPYECVCDTLLTDFHVSCTVDKRTVTRPEGHYYWLGCNELIGDTNETSLHSQPACKGVSLARRCFPGHCKREAVAISAETLDDQCLEGREGVLCGRCKPNHSLALGTSRCLKTCSSYSLYIILAVCAASGVMLILFLITCNLTVTEGTINGLLFYAHVMHTNSNSFFPGSSGVSNVNIFRLFIAWLNLDLGFELCFHTSMTQYQKTWLQFGFLFYVWVLEFFIVLLSHKYIFVTRLVGRNVVKVLATLFLISYAKAVHIAIGSLEFATLHHSDGTKSLVWALDGNITYLKGKHVPLFVLGIVLSATCLGYMFILLFIQCLQKRSNICCLRWVEKLRPFFEAYTGPCHTNYRFWPGFLFFVRSTLFFFSSILRSMPTFNLHITTAACVVILVFAFVSPNGVYKRWPLNILEFFFVVNLGVVSGLVAVFCSNHTLVSPTLEAHASYFVYPSVTVVITLFACILLFHGIKQLFSCQRCQKLSQLVAKRKIQFRKPLLGHGVIYGESREEVEALINDRHMPQVAHFNCYREPLIAED